MDTAWLELESPGAVWLSRGYSVWNAVSVEFLLLSSIRAEARKKSLCPVLYVIDSDRQTVGSIFYQTTLKFLDNCGIQFRRLALKSLPLGPKWGGWAKKLGCASNPPVGSLLVWDFKASRRNCMPFWVTFDRYKNVRHYFHPGQENTP